MSRANPRFRRANTPLPAVAQNLYQANIQFSLLSQVCVCTTYWNDGQAAGTGVSPTALAAGVNALASTWQPVMGNNCFVTGVIVRCLNNPTYVSVSRFLAAPLPGTVASASDGTIYSPTIIRQTAWRGQAGRGRVSIPGLPASFVTATGEALTAAAVTAYTAWGNQWLMGTIVNSGLTFTAYLYSRGLRTQTPKIPGAAQINSFSIRPLVGTVRRRKLGRGK
jgi:hypothetical protein